MVRASLVRALEELGCETEVVSTGEAALARLRAGPVELLIFDRRMPGLWSRDALRELQRPDLRVPIVILRPDGGQEPLCEVFDCRVGAYRDLPFRLDELPGKLRRLLAPDTAQPPPAPPLTPVPGLVGRSAAMQAVYHKIRTFAAAELNVLVTGETGVGKEVVARAIHALSRRAKAPFVPINCANLEPALLESELFGHLAGAFTDARRDKQGLLVEADGGVVLLDEVIELSGTSQAKLLGVIQDREVRPVGSVRATKINVRFMAACNKDIRQAVRHHRLREDLFHRLVVGIIHVPPLRERLEDLPDLAAHILLRLADETGEPVRSLAPCALQTLRAYRWPGNVRELENVLEVALAYSQEPVIKAAHIRSPMDEDLDGACRPLNEVIQRTERAHILKALRASRWIKGRAAAMLGIARTTLNRKIAEYGLDGESAASASAGSPTPAGMEMEEMESHELVPHRQKGRLTSVERLPAPARDW